MRWPLAVALLLAAGFASLGEWQWSKGEARQAAQALHDRRATEAAVDLPAALFPADGELAGQLHFRPLRLHGRFLPERQFLLDNQVRRERVGFHVITPFQLHGGDTVVLVDRGWVPAGATRGELPAIATPAETLTVHGRALPPPRRFFALSAVQRTPDWRSAPLPVWQALDYAAFARQSGLPTQGVIVRLDPAAPAGFERQWPRPDERSARHFSYALQWFGFALATLAIWAYLTWRGDPS